MSCEARTCTGRHGTICRAMPSGYVSRLGRLALPAALVVALAAAYWIGSGFIPATASNICTLNAPGWMGLAAPTQFMATRSDTPDLRVITYKVLAAQSCTLGGQCGGESVTGYSSAGRLFGNELRGVLRVLIDFHGCRFDLLITHLEAFTAARREAQWATYPAQAPEWPLDGAFATPDLAPLAVRVIGGDESDHRGLFVHYGWLTAKATEACGRLHDAVRRRRLARILACDFPELGTEQARYVYWLRLSASFLGLIGTGGSLPAAVSQL